MWLSPRFISSARKSNGGFRLPDFVVFEGYIDIISTCTCFMLVTSLGFWWRNWPFSWRESRQQHLVSFHSAGHRQNRPPVYNLFFWKIKKKFFQVLKTNQPRNPTKTDDFFALNLTPKNANFDNDVRMDQSTNWNQIFGSNNTYEGTLKILHSNSISWNLTKSVSKIFCPTTRWQVFRKRGQSATDRTKILENVNLW